MKEDNLVRAWGILPTQNADPIPVGKIPDGGTQYILQAGACNGISVLHTVTAGKTFYLTGWSLGIYTIASGYVYLIVRDHLDAIKFPLGYIYVVAGNVVPGLTGNLIPPMEVSENWDFAVSSSVADLTAISGVFGYEM